jgi:hypothetical protein
MVDHKRLLILSGSVHYARVLPSDWARVLQLARGMGLNTIQTYVFWSFHERERGELDWSSDRRNLTAFIKLAQETGLYVTLRIGPYACGEYTYGGIPTWMRDTNAKCFRCSDPVWQHEMATFVGAVVEQVKPLLLPNGGPVLMLQVENEYRGTDLQYLNWAVDMARNTTTAVPWILCHDLKSCTAVNNGGDKVLCTINDVWMDTPEFDTFPSPGCVEIVYAIILVLLEDGIGSLCASLYGIKLSLGALSHQRFILWRLNARKGSRLSMRGTLDSLLHGRRIKPGWYGALLSSSNTPQRPRHALVTRHCLGLKPADVRLTIRVIQ